MIDSVLRSFWRHPFRWLVGICLVILSLVVICSGGGNDTKAPPPPKTKTQNSTEPEINNPPIQAPGEDAQPEETRIDPEANPDPIDADETEADVATGRQIAASRRALPFLPLQTRNVRAEYKNQLPNGSLVIEVSYRGTKTEAISIWQNFLDRYQDPGTAYLVIYKPV